jgi:Zn-dependent peptidase ImmA (M78 family)
MTTPPTTTNRSLLSSLRTLMPPRALEAQEAASIAERQALKLLTLLDQHQPAVNVSLIAELPRIEVRVEPRLPVSGVTQWSRGRWLIGINQDDAPVRRRFTLAHEFKHVLDHPFIDVAYPDGRGKPSDAKAEAICDHFAACLLMPRPWVKQAWVNGIQNQQALAQLFGVSEAAMALRLRRLGLSDERRRWTALDPSNEAGGQLGRYFRRASSIPAPQLAMVGSPLMAGSRG